MGLHGRWNPAVNFHGRLDAIIYASETNSDDRSLRETKYPNPLRVGTRLSCQMADGVANRV